MVVAMSNLTPDVILKLKNNNRKLKVLNLSKQVLTNEIIHSLCTALSGNTHLKYLCVDNCNIDDDKAEILSHMLEKNTGLLTLSLANNALTKTGRLFIINVMIEKNKSLMYVRFKKYSFFKKIFMTIKNQTFLCSDYSMPDNINRSLMR